jgi:Kef-type K+ transport system membrane component KefB
MPEASTFTILAATLMVAALIGAVGVRLRQPLMVTFIAVGVLVGPVGLGWVTHEGEIELLATIGVSILLFLVGLKLDVEVIRSLGPVALSTGLGQVLFTSVVGFFISLGLGMSVLTSVYVAVALTFSSTIIIVKLLSEKREIDALHGRIAVGFLIVQDMVVILAMIGLSAIGPADGAPRPDLWMSAAVIVGKGLGLLAAVALLTKFVLPRVVHVAAKSQELLILFATAWAVALAAGGDALGFSKEVGAFLAGVSLASTPYRDAIGGRLVSLRDFLLLFFFLGLGASLELEHIGGQIGPALILSAFVLIGNPIIVMVIMGAMGYKRRTGFLSGLAVAQISEFSLILCGLGVALGHIDSPTLGLVTLVGIITIGLSTYLILYSHPIYERIGPWLRVFEKNVPHRETGEPSDGQTPCDAIIVGLGRLGDRIARGLAERDHPVLGVDFDPNVVSQWRREGLHAVFGDASDPELAPTLPLGSARCIVSTMPDLGANLTLLRMLREHGYAGLVVVPATTHRDADLLARRGAGLVLMPFADAAARAIDRIEVAMAGPPDRDTGRDSVDADHRRHPREAPGQQ